MFDQKRTSFIVLLCLIVVLAQCAIDPTVPPVPSTAIIAPASTVTPTPWVKQDILVQMEVGKGMTVWTDNITTAKQRTIDETEGVINTVLMDNGHSIFVQIDPRYNKVLVAKEIEDRLLASYPPPFPLRAKGTTLPAKGERE